jgi:fibronectin-binding autotransporter adhesin
MTASTSSRTKLRNSFAVGASLAVLAFAQNAQAQAMPCADGSPGPICVITVTDSSDAIVGTNGNATIVNNTGTIAGAPAISQGGSPVLLVTNEAGGTITGTAGVAINAAYLLNTAVTNRGTINGNVVVADPQQPSLFTAGLITFISDGGIVNGDVQLGTTGFTRANFVQIGADDGVTGMITAGAGVDIYTRGYNTSQVLTLGQQVLPATFEIAGYAALTTDTTLTLTGTGTSINLMGVGSVINNGTITPVSTAGLYPQGVVVVPEAVGYYYPNTAVLRRPQIPLGQPGSFATVFYGSALTSFTNNGSITGDVNLSTASFSNTGDINLVTSTFGSSVSGAKDTAFSFTNTGDIVLQATGARPAAVTIASEFTDGFEAAMRLRSAFDTTTAADVSISNSGMIVGGLHGRFAADEFSFVNGGTISGLDANGHQSRGVIMWVGEVSGGLGPDPETHYDAASARFTNLATGTINHSSGLFLSAYEASVTNHGTMSGAAFSPNALLVEQYLDADVDNTSLQFENTGTINGNVELDLRTTAVTVNNSGEVTGASLALNQTNFPDLIFGAGATFVVENNTVSDQTVNFTNTGTISTTAKAQSGLFIELDSDDDSDTGQIVNATINVVNSGTIEATGGATVVTRQFATFLQEGQVLGNPIAALALDASDIPGSSVVNINNQEGGLIRVGGVINNTIPVGYFPIPDGQDGALAVAVAASGRVINITNAGTIQGGTGTTFGATLVSSSLEPRDGYLAGAIYTEGDEYGPDDETAVYIASIDTVTNTATGVIIGSIDLGGNTDMLANSGSITGDVYLRDGDDTLTNFGTLTGNVFFGTGNDTFTQGVSAVFQGTADGEEGTDTFNLDITSGGTIDQTLYDHLVNFEVFNLVGQGQVDIELGDTDDALANDGTLEGDIDLGGGQNSFVNTGTVVGNLSGGEAADEVANEGTIDGSVDLGAGDNNLDNSGTVAGDVTSAGGDDEVANGGSISGNVDLGSGQNSFANEGTVGGNVTTGTGGDQVTNDGEIGGSIYLDGEPDANQALSVQRSLLRVAQALEPTGGDDTFTNTALVEGDVFAGDGNDTITNSGTILGNVDLGDGNDTLILQADWAIGGFADGGAGADAVNLTMQADTQPQVLDLAQFSNFETLALSGGTGIVTGNLAFAQIDVGAGRLIGAAESTIAGNVTVASGGTFGSAGTVNGNINVASGGTLSPGASPAVMTVVGNVSLAAGSNTVFEFVPAPGQSDQLLIDGTLTIASGATLDLVGNRPLTPGVEYDLIVADQINGQFTLGTWDRSLVQGFLRYVDGASADRLQLLGTFVFQAAAGQQPTAAVNYVNSLLVGGTASVALNTAIPQLLDSSGFASVAAFSLLTPEPYASATQLGVETGLGMARVSRHGLAAATTEEPALFGFGTGMGSWRPLAADGTLGTSRASNHAAGVVGGIGFGNSTGSVGAFVGYLDGRQRIAALDAQTNVDGMMAGLAAHLGADGFTADALAGYHWGKAETDRGVPGGGVAGDDYDLRALVLDVHASYALDMGGMALTPSAGVTHISARRSAANETGSAAYGLDVQRDSHAATFIDGSLELSGTADNAVRPWASVGLRHQLEGEVAFATASLQGATTTFTVVGAPRKATVFTAGAGLEADLNDAVTVSAAYSGEFGGGTGNAVMLGIRARF